MKFAQLTITPLDAATSGVEWLMTDQLGTPRMVFDKTGSLSGVSRHDYLPFGEELYAGVGGRTSTEGYNTDNVRQHFTGYENDVETGLNYAQARYQSPVQGTFTSVDKLMASANSTNPQSFNRYSYVLNNPTNLTDPLGLEPYRGADVGWSQIEDELDGEDYTRKSAETGRSTIAARDHERTVAVAVTRFFKYLPRDYKYIGALSWGYWEAGADGETLRHQTATFSLERLGGMTYWGGTFIFGYEGGIYRDVYGGIIGERGLQPPIIDPVPLAASLWAGVVRGAANAAVKSGIRKFVTSQRLSALTEPRRGPQR